jgi:hypothetical protein
VEGPRPANVGLWPIAPLNTPKATSPGNKRAAVEEQREPQGRTESRPHPGRSWRHLVSRPRSLQPRCPPFRKGRPQPRPQSPPPPSSPHRWRRHLLRCRQPIPQPGGSTPPQPQGHNCPENDLLPPRSATQSGRQRRQPLRCRHCSLRLGGDQEAQPQQWRQKGCRRTSSGSRPMQRCNGCGRWASNSKEKPEQKPPTRALERLPKWHRTPWKPPTQRYGGPGRSVWRLWAPSH